MEWKKNFEDLIRERRSCRSFDEREIEDAKKLKLKAFLEKSSEEAKGIRARFTLIESIGVNGKVGTYGMISGAKTYIVGIFEKAAGDIEDFGYVFEKIVLYATDLGLGTCWLAGIDRKTFESKIALAENEIVAVASPVGYAKKPRMKESLIRMVVGADKRKPWEQLFFEGNPGKLLSRERAEAFSFPLDMVRLAPSASNKQPWRVVMDAAGFHFCLQRLKGYSGSLPIDVQRNDIGIAMCHFELAARERGLAGHWVYDPPAGFGREFEYIKTWKKL